MKKFISILLVIVMCLSLALLFAACEEEPDTPPEQEPPVEEKVLLNGVPLNEYVIVYPEGDSDMEEAAGYLAAYAKTDLSVKMQSVSDQQPSAEYEILLGDTNRDTSSVDGVTLSKDEYYIAPLAQKVWISGTFPTKMYKAIDNFLASFVKVGNDMCFELVAPKKGSDFSHLRIMSYNLLGGTNNPGSNVDEERIEMVLDLIEKYEPDIFGLQEVVQHGWRKTLDDHFGDRYESVGVGRYASGGGESCAIYYLKSKFECLESGTKWLSLTPDVPGSYDWGSDYVRIYTYAKFKDKQTGKIFMHVNTHLDLDDYACEMQAELLMSVCEEYEKQGLPCIVTGDYNCRKGMEAYRILTSTGFLDSFDVADYTRNVLADESVPEGSISRYTLIDHIFLTSDVDVSYYQLCTEKYERANGEIIQPSDHRPVFIDCVLP